MTNLSIFQKHENLEAFYQTSDGTCFFTENNAKNHAKTLDVKDVKTVKRTKKIEPPASDLEPEIPENQEPTNQELVLPPKKQHHAPSKNKH